MRTIFLLTCLALMSACSSLKVRCDSRLRPINQPEGLHATTAVHAAVKP